MIAPFTQEGRARTRQGALLELLKDQKRSAVDANLDPKARAFIHQCAQVFIARHQVRDDEESFARVDSFGSSQRLDLPRPRTGDK